VAGRRAQEDSCGRVGGYFFVCSYSLATYLDHHVRENLFVSNLVQFSRQQVLLNRTSWLVKAPRGGCSDIHQKWRNTSIPASIGVISKLALM